jgi:hypothetical protein
VPAARTPSPHAALFEAVFSQPEHAASELRLVLPPEMSARLDWGSLALRRGTFRDPDLVASQVDLLFSVQCDGATAFVYVLFEHQRTSDPLMAFRLLRYMVRIWEAFLRDEPTARRLPAIAPVVLHHSRDGWTAPRQFAELLDLTGLASAAFAGFVPNFRFVLDDLSSATDADLHRRSLLGAVALFLLRDARESPDLLAKLRHWYAALRAIADAPGGVAALAALLQYAFQVGDIPEPELRTFAQQLGPRGEEALMTTEERILERGRAEWEARGEAKGRGDAFRRMLILRFGTLPGHVVERLEAVSPEQFDRWSERLFNASTLDDVFAAL